MPDQGSEGVLSPYLRNKRIKAALPYILGRVLDIGCGSGELSSHLPENHYIGVDINEKKLNIAKNKYPNNRFQNELPSVNDKFDTVISLAVIEHVNNPEAFLISLSQYLASDPKSRIVLTSPLPLTGQIHYLGSRIKLFSKSGYDHHINLFNYRDFLHLAYTCNLYLTLYKRFLFGMNQLVIYQKEEFNL